MKINNMSFLDRHKKGLESLGFWDEEYKSTTIRIIETGYKTEIIRDWYIADLVFKGDKTLIKWKKRFQPLTDEELKDNYGR